MTRSHECIDLYREVISRVLTNFYTLNKTFIPYWNQFLNHPSSPPAFSLQIPPWKLMHHVNGLCVIQMDCESSDESDHNGTEAASTSTCPHRHPRSSPTRLTLRQRQKRAPLRKLAASPPNSMQHLEPKRLSYQSDSSHPVKEKWTPTETSALIQFILIHTTGDRWPTHKQIIMLVNM